MTDPSKARVSFRKIIHPSTLHNIFRQTVGIPNKLHTMPSSNTFSTHRAETLILATPTSNMNTNNNGFPISLFTRPLTRTIRNIL
mmetsp:Transcript_9615/g.14012  ORF Transcript_9615/g.14012 Transcript_9615/m.14012 type:complete len:85 (+) Transcript_9615:92-346(+)